MAAVLCIILGLPSVNAADPRIFNQVPVKPPKAVTDDNEPAITPEFEEQLVEFFTHDQCNRVQSAVPRRIQHRLSPLVAAVVAYCEPSQPQAEDLFEWAESKDPNRDTIYVLHARYRWKRNPESALELWAKVALVTRNQGTKALAQQYLAGLAEGDETIDLNATSNLFLNLQVGASRESNPLGNAVSETQIASAAFNAQAAALYTHDTDFGTWSANYSLINNRYFNAHNADLLENDLELPVALRAGINEDVVLRPFASYLTLGSQPYQLYSGISVRGVAYRRVYKQYVQGSVFRDWYYRQEYKPQAGTHYRFDYNWEFFPFPWFTNIGFYIEHVRAERDSDDANSLSITYSHTDVGFQGYLEHNLRLLTPGLSLKAYSRTDADASSYNLISGEPTVKRRQDFTVEVTPSVTVPLEPNIHLYMYFTYSRIFSNIGINDYTDRNISNTIVGAALKAYVIK